RDHRAVTLRDHGTCICHVCPSAKAAAYLHALLCTVPHRDRRCSSQTGQRVMGTQRSHETAYYRCRFAYEYALANKISHPRNILFRERDLVPQLDQ
ncbi:hypothetical protein, partial [Streptomyces noursei]|uniref:hypothetical protein n=1 Tax=Streptomyces noursei TaxID=1971 RepID=UPI0038075B1E